MKKYTIVLVLSLILQLHAQTEQDRIETLKVVTSMLRESAKEAFGEVNAKIMFEQAAYPIDRAGLQKWYTTIHDLRDMMNQYGTKNNSLLNKYFMQLEECNANLINSIKLTYNTMFSPGVTKDVRKQNRSSMKSSFKNIMQKADSIARAVGNTKTSTVANRIAYDILFQFAVMIERIAKSAVEGIDFARD